MHDEARFLVHLASGNSGPYTLEDLRQLLLSGKAMPDDRVQDQSDNRATTILALVPDAAALAGQAAARVRRRTSDRLAAIRTPVPRPHAQRTPLPVDPAPSDDAPAAPPASSEPSTPPPRQASSHRLTLAVGLPIVLAVGTWLSWPIVSAWFRPTPPPPPAISLSGTWTISELPGHGGPWSLTFADGNLHLHGPDGTTETPFTADLRGPFVAHLRLPKPHPVFGAEIGLIVQHEANWCTSEAGEVVIQRSGP